MYDWRCYEMFAREREQEIPSESEKKDCCGQGENELSEVTSYSALRDHAEGTQVTGDNF